MVAQNRFHMSMLYIWASCDNSLVIGVQSVVGMVLDQAQGVLT